MGISSLLSSSWLAGEMVQSNDLWNNINRIIKLNKCYACTYPVAYTNSVKRKFYILIHYEELK